MTALPAPASPPRARLVARLFAPHFPRRRLEALLLLLLAGSARADDRATPKPTRAQLDAARALFAEGTRDEEALRWADALQKFQNVAEVKRTAGVRYHIALCEEKTGQTATALAHYTEALGAAREERNAEVLALLKEPFLKNLTARVPRLSFAVPRGLTGLEVRVDGRIVPNELLPVQAPIDPGAHHVEARAAGHQPYEKDLRIREREVVVLDVTLPSAIPNPTTGTTPTPSAAPIPAPSARATP